MKLIRKRPVSGTGQTSSVPGRPWLIPGSPEAFPATESLSCSRLRGVRRMPIFSGAIRMATHNAHFDNHKTQRNFQDILRNGSLDFGA
jgi:hypothetical protein